MIPISKPEKLIVLARLTLLDRAFKRLAAAAASLPTAEARYTATRRLERAMLARESAIWAAAGS